MKLEILTHGRPSLMKVCGHVFEVFTISNIMIRIQYAYITIVKEKKILGT